MGLSRLPTLVLPFAAFTSFAACSKSLSPAESLKSYYGVDIGEYKYRGHSDCTFACNTLAQLFPNATVVTGGTNSSAYTDYTAEPTLYWSNRQKEVIPSCYFEPSSPQEVAVAILLSRVTECPFAVKSGGHACYANASSIRDGITLVLKRLDQIQLSADSTSVSLGPGLRWGDVYKALEPHNLTPLGGRVFDVGVGGLILGGGISFLSGRYGWACDNVINYELVTADGVVINVNARQYQDLYFALRGGGNNFGIVTRFDVKTFPQGDMWGGFVFYEADKNDQVVDAMVEYSKNEPSDKNSALIVAYAWTSFTGPLIIGEFQHALPQPAEGPAIFKTFKDIPSLFDMTKNNSQANLTAAQSAFVGAGNRQTYWTASYKVDAEVLKVIAQTFTAEVNAIASVRGLQATMALAFISKSTIAQMSSNGGNPLGLTEADAPLTLLVLAFTWLDATDDPTVLRACQNIVRKTVQFARLRGLDHPFLYMNYASEYQSVLPSYGEDNLQKLRKISEQYDPTGVFEKLMPGGFKLKGAPISQQTLRRISTNDRIIPRMHGKMFNPACSAFFDDMCYPHSSTLDSSSSYFLTPGPK